MTDTTLDDSMPTLPDAPDNLPGDDIHNVLDENGNVIARSVDDNPETFEQAAHRRALNEVRGNFRDMAQSKFSPGKGAHRD